MGQFCRIMFYLFCLCMWMCLVQVCVRAWACVLYKTLAHFTLTHTLKHLVIYFRFYPNTFCNSHQRKKNNVLLTKPSDQLACITILYSCFQTNQSVSEDRNRYCLLCFCEQKCGGEWIETKLSCLSVHKN